MSEVATPSVSIAIPVWGGAGRPALVAETAAGAQEWGAPSMAALWGGAISECADLVLLA